MKMPDITKVQVVAIVKAGIALGLALGLPVSPAMQAEILAFAGVIASALVIADSIIRNGRARALANPESIAQLEKPAPPAAN